MYIYKITNKVNNKVYIGQTIHPIQSRFARHISDAVNNVLDTHLARAIRKYGKENFYVEQIDSAESQEELTEKEYYWIKAYNAVEEGYNETLSKTKCGGNTYKSKTEEEMAVIKSKIAETKMGGKNPNATKIKCLNTQTKEELVFDSLADCQRFFNESNHNFISRRIRGITKSLYKGIWNFAYYEDDYLDRSPEKGNRRSVPILVLNKETGEEKEFVSYAAAERYFGLSNKRFSSKAYQHKEKKHFTVGNFDITILN